MDQLKYQKNLEDVDQALAALPTDMNVIIEEEERKDRVIYSAEAVHQKR